MYVYIYDVYIDAMYQHLWFLIRKTLAEKGITLEFVMKKRNIDHNNMYILDIRKF